jgi:nucleotide-binding universal stress UspA family protein
MSPDKRPHSTHRHPDDWDEPVEIPEINREIGRILVPFDGSAGSERGLAYAELVAQIASAEIVIVVAFDPPMTVRRRGILLVEQAREEMQEDATELAEEAATLLIQRGHRARGIVVRGDPVQAILETIESEAPDVVVIGRRGLNQFEGVMLGSVSQRVASHATIPVLLA